MPRISFFLQLVGGVMYDVRNRIKRVARRKERA